MERVFALEKEEDKKLVALFSNHDHLLCSLLYCLCAVRGYKRVVRCFPHEAHDLVPCLEILERSN